MHLSVAVALLISFSHAPLQHFHPDDWEHRHSHGDAVPSTGHDQEAEGPAFEPFDHDANAQFTDWLAGDGTSAQKYQAECPRIELPETIVVLAEVHVAFAPRSHDPPAVRHLPARAPPFHSYL